MVWGNSIWIWRHWFFSDNRMWHVTITHSATASLQMIHHRNCLKSLAETSHPLASIPPMRVKGKVYVSWESSHFEEMWLWKKYISVCLQTFESWLCIPMTDYSSWVDNTALDFAKLKIATTFWNEIISAYLPQEENGYLWGQRWFLWLICSLVLRYIFGSTGCILLMEVRWLKKLYIFYLFKWPSEPVIIKLDRHERQWLTNLRVK